MAANNLRLPAFENARVLVYGDVMLDRYFYGDVSRISPEAPVQVVNVSGIESRPGGAANVAQNIMSLGSAVSLFGLVGRDDQAIELKTCFKDEKIDLHLMPVADFPTITKLRVLGQHQQLIRLDFENTEEKKINDDALFSEYCAQLDKVNIVVLSDYSKGALNQIERLIEAARKKKIPVLVDPKHKSYSRYAGATILTPNLKEFESIVGACHGLDDIVAKAQDLLKKIDIESLLITLGKDGMVLVKLGQDPAHFSSQAQDVFDVTGAGDTVIAVLAAGIAAGMKTVDAVELANIAAGIVVGRLGAQAVTVADLQHALFRSGDLSSRILDEKQLLFMIHEAKKRGEKIVMTNGCFDVLHVGHVDYLSKAKTLGDRLIVAVNDDRSVSRLKGNGRPLNSVEARMTVLSALNSVDWVISFSEETPARLIESLKPDVLVKGGDYEIKDIAGSDFVLKNGGKVLTIPIVDGFSTTALIQKMKGSL